jgi:hypothetical protein
MDLVHYKFRQKKRFIYNYTNISGKKMTKLQEIDKHRPYVWNITNI